MCTEFRGAFSENKKNHECVVAMDIGHISPFLLKRMIDSNENNNVLTPEEGKQVVEVLQIKTNQRYKPHVVSSGFKVTQAIEWW